MTIEEKLNRTRLALLTITIFIGTALLVLSLRFDRMETKFQKLVDIQRDQLQLQESMLDLIAPIQLTDPAEKVSNIPTPLEDSLMN